MGLLISKRRCRDMDWYGYRSDESRNGRLASKSRSAIEEEELERMLRPKEKQPHRQKDDDGFSSDDKDPKDVILDIIQRCPHDKEHGCCPIEEIRVWRNMDPVEAYNTISMLPEETLKRLAERHCECSSEQKQKNSRTILL
jgi:hypothetical protein